MQGTMGEPETMSPRQVKLAGTLLTSSLISRMPQAMSSLALLRVVLDAGGDYAFAGLLTSFYILAGTVGQPWLSRIIDRTGHARRVLLASAAVSSVAFLGIALTAPGMRFAAAAFALIAGFAAPPVEPVLRSLWPRIMRPGRQLVQAFSADAAVQEMIFVLGPLASAISIAVFGARGALITMGVFGLIGTVLFCSHRILAHAAPVTTHTGKRGSPLRVAAIRTLVGAQVAAGVPVGLLAITATAHAADAGVSALSGWGLALNGLGAFAGAVHVARHPFATPPERLVRPAMFLLALLYLPTAWVQAPPVYWLSAAFVSGICLAPYLTLVFTVVERTSPPQLATEANAWVVSAFSVGIGAGTYVAGLMTDHWHNAGTAAAVIGASVLTAAGAIMARPAVLRPAAPVEARELVLR